MIWRFRRYEEQTVASPASSRRGARQVQDARILIAVPRSCAVEVVVAHAHANQAAVDAEAIRLRLSRGLVQRAIRWNVIRAGRRCAADGVDILDCRTQVCVFALGPDSSWSEEQETCCNELPTGGYGGHVGADKQLMSTAVPRRA